jgi:hypothetical protein
MSFGVGRVNGFLWSEENTRLGIGWKYLILCVFGRNLGSGTNILLPLVMCFFLKRHGSLEESPFYLGVDCYDTNFLIVRLGVQPSCHVT